HTRSYGDWSSDVCSSDLLGGSKIVAAIAGLATLALAGRGLGVILFGTLILITSYVKAVNGIVKFQSWQLIVRFGGHGVAHGNPRSEERRVGKEGGCGWWE